MDYQALAELVKSVGIGVASFIILMLLGFKLAKIFEKFIDGVLERMREQTKSIDTLNDKLTKQHEIVQEAHTYQRQEHALMMEKLQQ